MFGVQREGLCWGPRLGSLPETSGGCCSSACFLKNRGHLAAEGVAGREPRLSPPEFGPCSLTSRSCGWSHVFPGSSSPADALES